MLFLLLRLVGSLRLLPGPAAIRPLPALMGQSPAQPILEHVKCPARTQSHGTAATAPEWSIMGEPSHPVSEPTPFLADATAPWRDSLPLDPINDPCGLFSVRPPPPSCHLCNCSGFPQRITSPSRYARG
ncbi:hypothetical protein NDU88_001581 [Pleurodeles waltl]|uniref:Secreted protein n=1 Tax=Pleurodeles waltl TaxID=8319 RepID=A0AAV7UV37_PLEWA|nr:hypothetical protein NDU88_001581 [Pleurodeles waltl]